MSAEKKWFDMFKSAEKKSPLTETKAELKQSANDLDRLLEILRQYEALTSVKK